MAGMSSTLIHALPSLSDGRIVLLVRIDEAICEPECGGCGQLFDFNQFCHDVKRSIKDITQMDPEAPERSTSIACGSCGKRLVKPNTTLMGARTAALPTKEDLQGIDLVIIAGTSLSIAPLCNLPQRFPAQAKRLVIDNKITAKHKQKTRPTKDLYAEADCETIFNEVTRLLAPSEGSPRD